MSLVATRVDNCGHQPLILFVNQRHKFTSITKSKTHKTMIPGHISTIARGSRIPLERTAIRKIIHPKPNWFAFLYTTLGSSVFDGFVSGLTGKSDKRIKQRWPEAYQFYTSTETYLLFSRIYIS